MNNCDPCKKVIIDTCGGSSITTTTSTTTLCPDYQPCEDIVLGSCVIPSKDILNKFNLPDESSLDDVLEHILNTIVCPTTTTSTTTSTSTSTTSTSTSTSTTSTTTLATPPWVRVESVITNNQTSGGKTYHYVTNTFGLSIGTYVTLGGDAYAGCYKVVEMIYVNPGGPATGITSVKTNQTCDLPYTEWRLTAGNLSTACINDSLFTFFTDPSIVELAVGVALYSDTSLTTPIIYSAVRNYQTLYEVTNGVITSIQNC